MHNCFIDSYAYISIKTSLGLSTPIRIPWISLVKLSHKSNISPITSPVLRRIKDF